MVLYFTGATNILYTFGGHAVTVEIMHAMWKPQKFKYIYLFATLYVFTLTLPSSAAMYWAFGDQLLNHSNAFSLLPQNRFRDAAVILMLIHQFITFGSACTPLYFVWEKVVGMHDTKSICLRALARLPVVIPIWFLAIIFPFFGPINSAVVALLVSFTVYIIPALAHMLTYRKASAREADAIVSKLQTTIDQEKDLKPSILIASDTVVVYEGIIREKPSSEEEAHQFIQGYSGKHAATVSSVFVTNLKTGFTKGDYDKAEIHFHEIPDHVIDKLLEEGLVLKVAGALIIEHPLIVPYVKNLIGTTDSVMGLPKALTDKLLKEAIKA